MADQDIFSGEANKPTTKTEVKTETLVGEGKKYASTDALAQGYVNADTFIDELKSENALLKEQVGRVAELEAVVDALKVAKGNSPAKPAVEEEGNLEKSNDLNVTDVATLIDQRLVAHATAVTEKTNLEKSNALMQDMFGTEAKAVFDSQCATPELRKTLTDLAKTNPDSFMKYIVNATGGKQQVNSTADGETKVNTTSFKFDSGRASDPECKEFYTELRKKNPNEYYSHDVQLKMQNMALKNRAKFFGSNA